MLFLENRAGQLIAAAKTFATFHYPLFTIRVDIDSPLVTRAANRRNAHQTHHKRSATPITFNAPDATCNDEAEYWKSVRLH